MATKTKLGPRVVIKWGVAKVKQGGKTVTVTQYSKIPSTIAAKFGLKETKPSALAPLTIGKDKKGRKILKGYRPTLGSKYLLASIGEIDKNGHEKFHRIRLPGSMGLTSAAATLKAGGKVTNIKFPNGEAMPVRKGK